MTEKVFEKNLKSQFDKDGNAQCYNSIISKLTSKQKGTLRIKIWDIERKIREKGLFKDIREYNHAIADIVDWIYQCWVVYIKKQAGREQILNEGLEDVGKTIRSFKQ